MTNDHIHDSTTSNVLSWSAQGAHMQHAPEEEASAEVDEPPDDMSFSKHANNEFKRSAVQKPKEKSKSLLTKALNHPEEEEEAPTYFRFSSASSRRRSMNSNISLASTVDLTPDTGFTSPARTSTPSPPPSMFSLPRLNAAIIAKPDLHPAGGDYSDASHARGSTTASSIENLAKAPISEGLAKKRCISFACGPKPETKKPTVQCKSPELKPVAKPATEGPKPERRTCIKFACPSKPSVPATASESTETTPTMRRTASPTKEKGEASTFMRINRSSSINRNRTRRSSTPRPLPHLSGSAQSKKYLTANHGDMNSESSRFHEFASDEPQEEDWIRLNLPVPGRRLTINDTLRKENEIRRLGKEAEEEALDEFEEEEQGYVEDDENEDDDEVDAPEDDEDDDDDDDDDEDDGGSNADDDQIVYDSAGDELSGEDASDGYNTDNEIGFADSDDDDGDNLELWTLSQGRLSEGTPIYRRPSLASNHSDSSTSSEMAKTKARRTRGRTQRIKIRPGTPELPDSTDFVCGTLDEDRVLEDAYISCIAAKRREKLHVIPQDIDPSFPTSEPEDDDAESRQAMNDSDGHVWIHGELEDLHHDKARGGERHRKKSEHVSPKRYRSPPPKRHHSPAPKARGRSPRRPVDRLSPRRMASPAPRRLVKSPTAPLGRADNPRRPVFGPFPLGPVIQTKSLPRASAIFPQHIKASRRAKHGGTTAQGYHVRGAIDIVKGLEQKRQRRKEKFKEKYFHKHCNRARKGQTNEKKPQPGQGAERMREVGLFMAGKRGQGQFVLSI